MKKIFLLLPILTAIGCTAPKYNYQPVSTNISKPAIGVLNEAFVGDKMLVQGTYTDREAYYVPEVQKKFLMTVPRGYFLKTGEDAKGTYYQANNNIPDGAIFPPNMLIQGILVTEKNDFCLIDAFSNKNCHFKNIGEKKNVTVASDNSFQQTLIYSGKVGNKINIGYREYSSNAARPAFNNDVEYDLSESKTIGYKGALLEIADASNQSIKYRVLKNFNSID